MKNYFKTTAKLAALTVVFIALGTMPTWAAGDIDTMLFGPAKKITAKKNNPMIPKISKTDPQKKNITPKVKSENSSKTTAKSSKKEDKSLTEKIRQIEDDIDETLEEEADSLLKDTWVEKLSTSLTPKNNEDTEIGRAHV